MTKDKKRKFGGWGILGVILLILVVGLCIFGYIRYLKKSTAELLETVPNNAAFVFQINDNEDFVKNISQCKNYINDVFGLEALAGFEYFIDLTKNDKTNHEQVVISGHQVNDKIALMLSFKMNEASFSKLLSTLQIDNQDYTTYQHCKFYEVGTHYRKFVITFQHGLFTAAEDRSILEQSISGLGTARNLYGDKAFQPIIELLKKNDKQNWLIINHENFVACQSDKINETYQSEFAQIAALSSWSAYQIRFSGAEMTLSGYSLMKENSFFQRFISQNGTSEDFPKALIPANSDFCLALHVPDLKSYTNNSSTEAAQNLIALNAQESYYFSVTYQDTLTCDYLLVKGDTSQAFITSILPETHTMDSVKSKYKKFNIYTCGKTQFATALSDRHAQLHPNYFIDNQGYYIFADSVETLKKYIDEYTSGHTFEQNQQFLYALNIVPSNNRFMFYYQNQDNGIRRILSKSFIKKKSNFEQLQTFVYVFSQPMQNLIPNNLYIKFATN